MPKKTTKKKKDLEVQLQKLEAAYDEFHKKILDIRRRLNALRKKIRDKKDSSEAEQIRKKILQS